MALGNRFPKCEGLCRSDRASEKGLQLQSLDYKLGFSHGEHDSSKHIKEGQYDDRI